MSNREKNCEARRQGDQMQCGRCALAWDLSDPEPPACPKHELARDALERSRQILKPVTPKLDLTELREMPLRRLPSCGIRGGLYVVNWPTQPTFAYVVMSIPLAACQARDYVFYGDKGQPLLELQIREDAMSRSAMQRSLVNSIPGEWVSA